MTSRLSKLPPYNGGFAYAMGNLGRAEAQFKRTTLAKLSCRFEPSPSHLIALYALSKAQAAVLQRAAGQISV